MIDLRTAAKGTRQRAPTPPHHRIVRRFARVIVAVALGSGVAFAQGDGVRLVPEALEQPFALHDITTSASNEFVIGQFVAGTLTTPYVTDSAAATVSLTSLLEDDATVISLLNSTPFDPLNHYYCILNATNPSLVEAAASDLSGLLRHDGCNSAGGMVAIRALPGAAAAADSDATNTPTPTVDDTDSAPTDDLWSRVSQEHLDAYFVAYTEAQTAKWAIENRGRGLQQGHETSMNEAREALAAFWSSEYVLAHNRFALAQQRDGGLTLYRIVLGLVVAGLVMTVVQFLIAAISGFRVRQDLPAIKAVRNADTTTIETTVLQRQVELAETEFKFELEKIAFSVKTSIIGVVVLLISLAFVFLYLQFVFPLAFPQAPT